ncbi:MAG TPA: CapA family protein [Micromonosporaceae bacterium]|nr:CapA family protein [Micromonosporaceae bacterium]
MFSDDRPAAPGRVPRRPALVIGAAVALLLVLGLAGVAALTSNDEPATLWRAGPIATPEPVPTTAAPSPTPAVERVVTLSATGDIIMGSAPDSLPARDGEGFFDGVRRALAADVVMGNLEQPITDDTGYRKCRPRPAPSPGGTARKRSGCHQFRVPPKYAGHLRDAGFEVLNQANNHGNDFGDAGYRNTQKALERYDLRHTGAPDQITVVEAEGVRVAVVGFSSYRWSNSLIDIPSARRVVQRAAGQADLVVVQVHMGAEGSDRTRVKPGTEMFLGENRGDPVRFSHAVIEAGADLVVGHGPHVLRGLEFHRGRLIAYSLGNFAGGAGTLNNDGRLGWGGVLKVSLRPDGTFASGQFVATYLDGGGKPVVDGRERGLGLVRDLSRRDFPTTGARLDAAGEITEPA